MTPTEAKTSREEQVDIHDLEPLLRKSLNCKQLEVVDYTATKLLPLGENYCSILVKIDVKIRRGGNAQTERLQLAAKTINRVPRPIVEWPLVLKKEVFMYQELMPAYRDLERESGVKENELIDVLPKYIGHRYSLVENNKEVDEHSLLLMENIKAQGYYNCSRHVGLDVHHAKKALTSLARYHALGITLKHKRPDFFEKAMMQARVLGIDFIQLNEGFAASLNDFMENQSIVAGHLPTIESSYEHVMNDKLFTVPSDEPWATITHGDFWVNNMLFHKNKQGDVDDVKLVDFQTYLFHSALKDLPYFFCCSLDDDTSANRIDELLTVYYETFVRALEHMGINSKVYTRESFNKELKKQAINEFALCALAMKFFVFEINAEHQSESLVATVFESKCSDLYKERLKRLISTYEIRGWF